MGGGRQLSCANTQRRSNQILSYSVRVDLDMLGVGEHLINVYIRSF